MLLMTPVFGVFRGVSSMPARPEGPWFWKARGKYFATIGGERKNLKTADLETAWSAFYTLMGEAGTPVPQTERQPVSVGEVLERFGDWAEKHRKPETAA